MVSWLVWLLLCYKDCTFSTHRSLHQSLFMRALFFFKTWLSCHVEKLNLFKQENGCHTEYCWKQNLFKQENGCQTEHCWKQNLFKRENGCQTEYFKNTIFSKEKMVVKQNIKLIVEHWLPRMSIINSWNFFIRLRLFLLISTVHIVFCASFS